MQEHLQKATNQPCRKCGIEFTVFPEDLRFFELFDVPPFKDCFSCRLQQKMAFYNRRSLYKRKSDITGKEIISIYSPDKDVKAYETRAWYSDQWDPLDYGQEFDFSRPFFEQFAELLQKTPHNSLAILGDNLNSDYTSDVYKLKNCYLVFDGEQAENAYHGETFVNLKSCMDFLFLSNSELCYECTACDNCYNLKFSAFSQTCSDSWFLRDCISCKNCFGCTNLRQKEFCIFNEQKTEEEYKAFLKSFQSSSHKELQTMKQQVQKFWQSQPARALRGTNNEDSFGDSIRNSKNAYSCFDCADLRDCRYLTDCLMGAKDCMDVHVWGDGMECCYNCELIGNNVQNMMGCIYVLIGCSDMFYSYWCTRNCKNCFGCVSLQKKQYCILNKQYSKEEYEELLPKIITHMKETGEWGEFFPADISLFGYNETLAAEYFPLNKEKALEQGFKWSDYEMKVEAKEYIDTKSLPDIPENLPENLTDYAIKCEVSGKFFKLTQAEINFYKNMELPLPRRHPNQRHLDRMKIKNLYNLRDHNCSNCSKELLTTYDKASPQVIVCDDCYFKEVY